MTLASPAKAVDNPPPIGHNQPPGVSDADIVEAFVQILIGPRSKQNTPCFLDAIMHKAIHHRNLGNTTPDVMTIDLMGFTPQTMPIFNHSICSDFGHLSEAFITTLFKMTRPDLIDAEKETMNRLESEYHADPIIYKPKNKTPRPIEWKAADFLLGRHVIIENKFRFNSYQGRRKQISAARIYKKLGYDPVFLHLSSDLRARKELADAGWDVRAGEDAISYISEHTGGRHLPTLLRSVREHPLVKNRLAELHKAMTKRRSADIEMELDYGPPEVQNTAHKTIARSPKHLSAIVELIPKQQTGIIRQIRDYVEKRNDEALADIQNSDDISEDDFDALKKVIDGMDVDLRKNLSCHLMAGMDDINRLDVLSRIA